MQQMIINDGGKGEYTEDTSPMLGIWDSVLAVGSLSPPFELLTYAFHAIRYYIFMFATSHK